MSGYDETNPEAYRPTEPEAAADSAHSGVDSWSASSQADPATVVSGGESPSATENHGGYEDPSQAYTADASHSQPALPQGAGALRWDETRQLPAEPPTSQLPAEPPTALRMRNANPPRPRPSSHAPTSTLASSSQAWATTARRWRTPTLS